MKTLVLRLNYLIFFSVNYCYFSDNQAQARISITGRNIHTFGILLNKSYKQQFLNLKKNHLYLPKNHSLK